MISKYKLFLINMLSLIIFGALIFTINYYESKKISPAIIIENTTVDNHDFAFFLINADNPLPRNYEIETKTVYEDYLLDIRCADYAIEMLLAAESDGIDLMVCSAYRSAEVQEKIFKDYVKALIKKGYTVAEAKALTELQIAYPNESEHGTGLALDIVSKNWFTRYDDLTEDFEYTKEFKWLSDNSWKYGFILRYPKGKTNITGFLYEPWHYRFVGLQKAEQIYCSGLSLEEYIEQYENNGEKEGIS